MIEFERPPVEEKALLVRLVLPQDSEEEVEESLDEMRRLAWTAGADVVLTAYQRREKPCPATLIGPGKVAQLKAVCEELEADLAIFDSDLTPAQGANLSDRLGVKVVDRTQLILDIFAQRARTVEGKHQVELAQLEYLLPRLRGKASAMMRQQGGIGVRGPGEQKLEVDRRVVRERISRLKSEIDETRKYRRVQRKRRQESAVGTVALVGYTNAGKSTLLNALTGADVLVEDKLFATLDPTSRRCGLPSGRTAVFVDTVGFIRKLPHSLVAAFRATLEEVNEADLVLLVADASHPAMKEHVAAVHEVLREIKAEDVPMLNVLNKIDALEEGQRQQLRAARAEAVLVSAKAGEGLDTLLREVDQRLAAGFARVTLRIPQQNAGLVSRIHEQGRVLAQRYEDNHIVVEAEVNSALKGQMSAYIA